MTRFVTLLGAAAAALAPTLGTAQTPPIKPGLWQVQSQRQVDGKPATPPADKMKNLSPETRTKIEAMMKENGISVSGDGATRICLSKDSLDAGRWQSAANCQTEFSARNASAWKWHSVCPQSETVLDGEALFANAENYTVNTTSTRTFRGETKTSKTTIHAKWLAGDCGDLKPLDLKH